MHHAPTIPCPRRLARGLLGAAGLALGLALSGCASEALSVNHTPDEKLVETAQFYWPYAALAADVYQTEGRIDSELALVTMSSWLREELRGPGEAQAAAKYAKVLDFLKRKSQSQRLAENCSTRTPVLEYELGETGSDVKAVRCLTGDSGGDDGPPDPLTTPEGVRLVDREPREAKDCEYHGDSEPFVPVHRAIQEYGWERVPELQRQLHPRGWSIFVPGLAIDVWRRKLSGPGGGPQVEYALVYRGTVGSGGWFSNLRAVTAFTPFVWDQYRQALRATNDLVAQIHNLHRLSDAIFERRNGQATRIQITSVGHSLGAGLAKYTFLRVPEVTRVVGFDPSPIDGESTFSPQPVSEERRKLGARDRDSVLQDRRQALNMDHRNQPGAAILMLYEEGEALTRVAGCHTGALWGGEGGPDVRCEGVNLSGGSIFYQHNMAQLACTLYLAKDGKLMQRRR